MLFIPSGCNYIAMNRTICQVKSNNRQSAQSYVRSARSCSESKGMSDPTFVSTFSLPEPANRTGASSPMNSLITWRQAPQGPTGVSESGVEIAKAMKRRCPAVTAAEIALLSAQTVRPKDLFSTFVPMNTVPSSQRSAAPTRKWEYGEYEASAAFRAAVNNKSISTIILQR